MNKLRKPGDSDDFSDISFEDIHFNLSSGNTMITNDPEAVLLIQLVMYTIYEKKLIIIRNEPNMLINRDCYVISIDNWYE